VLFDKLQLFKSYLAFFKSAIGYKLNLIR